jgi:CBS domain-containing protein
VTGTQPAGIVPRTRALLGNRRVSIAVRSAGYLLVFVGFLVALQGSLIGGLWLVLMGWLLSRAARAGYNAGRLSALLAGLTVRDAIDTDPPSVAPGLVLETLVEEDGRVEGGSGVYAVRQGGELLGLLDVLDADAVPRPAWASTHVDEVMKPLAAMTAVPPDERLIDTVARFERIRREAFPVVDPARPAELLGLVTRERVHALLRSRAARTGPSVGRAGQ